MKEEGPFAIARLVVTAVGVLLVTQLLFVLPFFLVLYFALNVGTWPSVIAALIFGLTAETAFSDFEGRRRNRGRGKKLPR